MTDQALDIAAILIGGALAIIVGLRWRSFRYSGTAFVLIPQAIVAAYRGHWTIAVVIMAVTIPFFVMAMRSKNRVSDDRRHDAT